MNKQETCRCKKCNAYCCKHIAVHIDTPADKEDYDNIRWYLLHQNVWVSVDFEDNWIVEFKTPCKYVTDDFKCSIYKDRPDICKKYPGDDELCEGETDEPSYKELFRDALEFERYVNKIKR